MSCRARQHGFTLLEVLAAFVIFALVFATSLQILSGSLRNTQRSADYTLAALWAQSHMDGLGLDPPLEEGSYSGEFDGGYRWEMEVSRHEPEPVETAQGEFAAIEITDAEVPVDLYLIELDVLWGDPPRERRAQFRTLRSVTPEAL